MKHSPSPWRHEDDGFFGCIRDANNEIICGGEIYEGRISDNQDTRLMVAAPEMYEALIKWKQFFELVSIDPYIIPNTEPINDAKQALAAIAKAEGK